MRSDRKEIFDRQKLIERFILKPESAPYALKNAIKTQGGFAKYCDIDAGIHPISLNTLKSNANKYLEKGGWIALDTARKELNRLILGKRTTKTPSQKSKNDFKKIKTELENKINNMNRSRLRIEQAYLELLRICRMGSIESVKVKNELERHSQKWNMSLGLTLIKGADDGK